MKIDAENLRADVRDAYVFLRSAINLAIGVFIASSVSFSVIMSQYVAWRVYNSMEMERMLIAISGFCTSFYFSWAVAKSKGAYKISRNHYLYPARKELGVTESPGGIDPEKREMKRKNLETWVFRSFFWVNVIYCEMWIWILFKFHAVAIHQVFQEVLR